jgi:hypothetical protein
MGGGRVFLTSDTCHFFVNGADIRQMVGISMEQDGRSSDFIKAIEMYANIEGLNMCNISLL